MTDREHCLPKVLTTNNTESGVVLLLHVPDSLVYFDGHFDQAPLLPGVVQIQWAANFGKELLGCQGGFSSLEVIKFRDVIVPNQQVELTLTFKASNNKLLFEYRSNTEMCSSGRIVLNSADLAEDRGEA